MSATLACALACRYTTTLARARGSRACVCLWLWLWLWLCVWRRYRERTQWIKDQYKQDLRRIRQVQEKLFKQARALQAKVEEAKGRETPVSDSSGPVAYVRAPHCATKEDHVARLADEGSGLIKELSADLSRLQAEMDELRKKMQRERAARQAAEAAAREAKNQLHERDELLAELRKKCVRMLIGRLCITLGHVPSPCFVADPLPVTRSLAPAVSDARYKEVEADLAAREAALKAAEEAAEELRRKWQAAQDEIASKLKVINALKFKNRKLDGQCVACAAH